MVEVEQSSGHVAVVQIWRGLNVIRCYWDASNLTFLSHLSVLKKAEKEPLLRFATFPGAHRRAPHQALTIRRHHRHHRRRAHHHHRARRHRHRREALHRHRHRHRRALRLRAHHQALHHRPVIRRHLRRRVHLQARHPTSRCLNG